MNARRFSVLMLAIVMLLGFTMSANAEVEKSASADVSFMSNYVWRGLKLSEDWVIQPSVTFSIAGFSANLWANWDSDYEVGGDRGELTETDYTLSYGFSPVEKVSLEGGYIYYGLEGIPDTQELYVSASADVLLSPSVTLYWDIDEGNGGFMVLSVGHSFALPDLGTVKGASFDVGASASVDFDNKVMGPGKDGNEFTNFYNGEISASLGLPIGQFVTISPMIAYSFPLSKDAKAAMEAISFDMDKDILYGGVNVSASF